MPTRLLIVSVALSFSQFLQAGGSPDWVSFAAGVYDLMRPRHRTMEFEIEYKFHIRRWGSPFPCLEFLPLVGLMANVQRGGYLYAGLNFDFLFFNHIQFTPALPPAIIGRGRAKT
jgi:hypothetical protein